MLTPTDCAYAAGFLDGEGTISINSTAPGRPYRLTLEVSGTVAGPLLWLRDRWGGSLRWRAPQPVHNKRGYTSWQLASRGALAFLVDVRPWLIVKADQADVAILFAQTRRAPAYLRHHPADRSANIAEGVEARGRLVQLRKEAT